MTWSRRPSYSMLLPDADARRHRNLKSTLHDRQRGRRRLETAVPCAEHVASLPHSQRPMALHAGARPQSD